MLIESFKTPSPLLQSANLNQVQNEVYPLTDEQRNVFMEVVEESLKVSQNIHLFKWLQGGFQYLLGHEVMVYGVKDNHENFYKFDFLTSVRYFNDTKFNDAIKEKTGIIQRAIAAWKISSVPLFVTNLLPQGIHHHFAVMNVSEEDFNQSELQNFIVHGYGEHNSIVIFGRLHKNPCPEIAKIVEMLMPHLHCTLSNLLNGKIKTLQPLVKTNKKLSSRESQVIQYLYLGKTNWEISNILDVSPLTVKNHVQNIIKKLNVTNRRQAATKAAKLGLIKQQSL